MADNENENGYGQMIEGADHFHQGMEIAELGEEGGALAEAAPAVAEAAPVAAVAAAGYAGYEIGQGIENETHVGEHVGDFAYEHSDPQQALAAANSFDDASSDWHAGHPLDAAGDVLSGAGHMIAGFFEGNSDSE